MKTKLYLFFILWTLRLLTLIAVHFDRTKLCCQNWKKKKNCVNILQKHHTKFKRVNSAFSYFGWVINKHFSFRKDFAIWETLSKSNTIIFKDVTKSFKSEKLTGGLQSIWSTNSPEIPWKIPWMENFLIKLYTKDGNFAKIVGKTPMYLFSSC